MSRLTELLGIALPIIQAPMAGVSTPALAATVSNAGGLGSIGIGAMDGTTARKAIQETRAQTNRPFNVNVFCHAPALRDAAREAKWQSYLAPVFAQFHAVPPDHLGEIYTAFSNDEAMLQMLLEERPAVVSFHFGLPPPPYIDALRQAGIRLLASATNRDEARQLADAGLDAVIAQGIEAGGHRGVFHPNTPDEQLPTATLTRLLVRVLDIPVIAAGGIMDGAGIASVLALGAQAAQLGTAFVPCPESAADSAYRAALRSPASAHTVLTTAISGRPARGIANAFTRLGAAPDCPPIPSYPVAYDVGKALHAAAKATGCFDYAAQWAGQGAPLARELPAADLITLLWEESKAAT